MTDRFARIVALLALALSLTASYGSASADPVSEPDAYLLAQRVADLDSRIEALEEAREENDALIDDLFANDGALDERTAMSGCVGYSDFHYVRERVNGKGKRWRLPLAVWMVNQPACRMAPGVWKPQRRAALTPLKTGPR